MDEEWLAVGQIIDIIFILHLRNSIFKVYLIYILYRQLQKKNRK